jgi:hypothetical protein
MNQEQGEIMYKSAYCFIALFCVTHFACNDTSPTGSGNTANQYLNSSYEYYLSNGILIVKTNKSFCEDSILKQVNEMHLHYATSDDTLFLKPVDTVSEMFSDSSILVLKRAGSGSGLQGSWVIIGSKETETSQIEPYLLEGSEFTITFTETRMETFSDQSPVDQLYSAYKTYEDFNITVSKNGNDIILTGNATQEQVTITIVGNSEQIVYKSSDTGKEDHIYYSTPTECPNDMSPDWLVDFIYDNIVLSKRMPSSSIRLKATGICDIFNFFR